MKVLTLASLISSMFVWSAYAQNCEQITAAVNNIQVLMVHPLMNGLRCSEAQQRIMDGNPTCTDNVGEQPLIAYLNAQTRCLRDFIEGRQALRPGVQIPIPSSGGYST